MNSPSLLWIAATVLLVSGSTRVSSAAIEDGCMPSAFRLMAGDFDAKGKKIGESGDLEDFSESFTGRMENNHSVAFFDGKTKYGTWSLVNDEYQLVTYDAAGKPGAPIAVTYTCRLSSSDTVRLTETWTSGPDQIQKFWNVKQIRTLKEDQLISTTTAREKGSLLPPVVLSDYIASRKSPSK